MSSVWIVKYHNQKFLKMVLGFCITQLDLRFIHVSDNHNDNIDNIILKMTLFETHLNDLLIR